MNLRPLARSLAVLLVATGLAGCGFWDVDHWNQKVIVEVETPDGLVAGSSVQRVKFSRAKFNVPDGPSYSFKATGEAVAVEVGPGRFLFALLTGERHFGDAGKLAPLAFVGLASPGFASPEAVKRVASLPVGSRAPLPRTAYPLLVTFADIDDPKTVRRVDPDDLAASFGPGVALQSITLEITDEKVTEGRIEAVLGWWGNKQLFEQIWPNISREMRSLLSSVNWKKG
jgi:hypothetical protein